MSIGVWRRRHYGGLGPSALVTAVYQETVVKPSPTTVATAVYAEVIVQPASPAQVTAIYAEVVRS